MGFGNYINLFTSYYFFGLIRNSIILTVLPAIITCIISFATAYFIIKLPNKWTKLAALCIIAIPAFIPLPLLLGIAKSVFSAEFIFTDTNLFMVPSAYPWLYSIVEALRYMIYPTAIGVLLTNDSTGSSLRGLLRVAGGYFLVRVAFTFVLGHEATVLLYNPAVYQTADTFSSFVFRKGLQEANYGYASAADTLRILAQVVIDLTIALGIKKLFFRKDDRLFLPDGKNHSPSLTVGIFGSILMCAGSVGIIYFLFSRAFSQNVSAGEILSNPYITAAFARSFIYSIGAAVLFTIFSHSMHKYKYALISVLHIHIR
jgi:putative aldouronate transport system permease protein